MGLRSPHGYRLWFVLAALGTSGKTMLFPGNIYNFNPTDRVMTPDTPQRPQTPT